MATVKKLPAKTESVEKVLEGAKVTLELTLEEAAGLRTLLYCGTHVDTLRDLDLDTINNAIRNAGVTELHKNYRNKRFGLNLAKVEEYPW